MSQGERIFAYIDKGGEETINKWCLPSILCDCFPLPTAAVTTECFDGCFGSVTVSAISTSSLPYGGMARILIAWLASKVYYERAHDVSINVFGSEFLEEIGFQFWDRYEIAEQMERISKTSFFIVREGAAGKETNTIVLAKNMSREKRRDSDIFNISLHKSFIDAVQKDSVAMLASLMRYKSNDPVFIDTYMRLALSK